MASETALPPESPLSPNLPTIMLENQWRLTEFTYNGAQRDFNSIKPILVTFQPGVISAQACNSVSFLMDAADVSTENSYLLTRGDGTARGCDNGGTEQEGIFGQAMLATNQYKIVDDMLTLEGKQARLVLVIDNDAEKPAD